MSTISPLRKKRRSSSEECGGGDGAKCEDDSSVPDCCESSDVRASASPDARGVTESREVIEARRYEYLDHPADIQLHAWGESMEKAVEALMTSMYGYMTDLSLVSETYEYYFSGSGRDLDTMLFSFMDEALGAFQSEPFFVAKRFKVTKIDFKEFVIEGFGCGESYDLENKHSQEADIKAITYSNMQINIGRDRTDLFVIVDI